MSSFPEYKKGDPSKGDSRGPCPALNTLANHGLLPRDGRNIGQKQLIEALQKGFNVEFELAKAIAAGAPPEGSDLETATFDLEYLNNHDHTEHDASLTRKDTVEGDNHTVQPDLVEKMLNDSESDVLTIDSLAKTRVRRDADSHEVGSPDLPHGKPGDLNAALNEAIFILTAMGAPEQGAPLESITAPKSKVETWFLEERLPDGYNLPEDEMSIDHQGKLTKVLEAKIAEIKASA